jgi:hypothetical protein
VGEILEFSDRANPSLIPALLLSKVKLQQRHPQLEWQ